jgi:hypothetical protein
MLRKTIFSFGLLGFIFQINAMAQTSQTLFHQFEKRFEQLNQLIYATDNEQHYPVSIASVLPDSGHIEIDEQVDAQVSAFNNKTGLSVIGQSYYRLDDGLGFDEDDAVSRYKAKFQVELNWNLFQSAIYKRKGAIREIELQGDIDRLKLTASDITRIAAANREMLTFQKDSLLSGVLMHRILNLDLLTKIQQYQVENGYANAEEMLKILEEKSEAERLLASLHGEHQYATQLANFPFAVIRADSALLMAAIKEKHPLLNAAILQAELLSQKGENTAYWDKVKIAPFVRYSEYWRTAMGNSRNVDLGLSFNFPISSEQREKSKAYAAESRTKMYEADRLYKDLTEEIKRILANVEILNKAIEVEYDRIKKLRVYLQQRNDSYESRMGEYSLPMRMKEYNIYLRSVEEIVKNQYKRDALLQEIQLYAGDSNILSYQILN